MLFTGITQTSKRNRQEKMIVMHIKRYHRPAWNHCQNRHSKPAAKTIRRLEKNRRQHYLAEWQNRLGSLPL